MHQPLRYYRSLVFINLSSYRAQGHPVGLIGEDGGPTVGALSDGVQGIESSEHHTPPEMLDGLDGKIAQYIYIHIYIFFTTKISFRSNIFPSLYLAPSHSAPRV